MKFLRCIGLVALIFSSTAFAADGSSGCGPAWFVLKDNSLVSSALRATTNGILFPVVTIGMTIGTSNCTRHNLVETEKESLHFVTMNYFELKGEIAKGEGQFLSSFSSTMGCPSETQAELAKALKQNYKNVFPSSDIQPETALTEVYKVILADPHLVNQCSLRLG